MVAEGLRRPARDAHALEAYGFSGGTYPSPDGAPGEGWRTDPMIAAQFNTWYAQAPASRPWCTTVSFVNPHDIAWWYRWTSQTATEASAPSVVNALHQQRGAAGDTRKRSRSTTDSSLLPDSAYTDRGLTSPSVPP